MFSSVLAVTLRFKGLTLSHRSHLLLNLYLIANNVLINCPRFRLRRFRFLECDLKTLLKVHDLNDWLRNIGKTVLRITPWSSIIVLKSVIMMFLTIYVKSMMDQT